MGSPPLFKPYLFRIRLQVLLQRFIERIDHRRGTADQILAMSGIKVLDISISALLHPLCRDTAPSPFPFLSSAILFHLFLLFLMLSDCQMNIRSVRSRFVCCLQFIDQCQFIRSGHGVHQRDSWVIAMITKIFEDGGQRSDSDPATNQNVVSCFIVIEMEVATHSEMDGNITFIEFQYLNHQCLCSHHIINHWISVPLWNGPISWWHHPIVWWLKRLSDQSPTGQEWMWWNIQSVSANDPHRNPPIDPVERTASCSPICWWSAIAMNGLSGWYPMQRPVCISWNRWCRSLWAQRTKIENGGIIDQLVIRKLRMVRRTQPVHVEAHDQYLNASF